MKKLFFTLSLLLLITCSKDSTEGNSSVYVAPPTNTTNPTTTPTVTQYTLSVTAGSGGRAGRVQFEVLVAGSSIAGDAADDTQLADS